MKATWAVACLLCVLALATDGCATKKAAEAPKPAEGSSGTVPEGKVVATDPAGQEPATSIREDNVSPSPVPPSPARKSEGTASGDTAPKPPEDSQTVAYIGPTYRLGPEDSIRISVWENKELTLDLVVRPDGKISMPLIQDVEAEGLTAVELANKIHQKLLAYLKEPQVSVIVLAVNAPKYYVIGNVAKPGPYLLRGETSILQALAVAGGFSPFASPKNIKLIRNNGGKQETRKVNYFKMIEDDAEGNYILRSGDTIVVP